jgi:CubicO group peptidase (beta-lactamase class C family)
VGCRIPLIGLLLASITLTAAAVTPGFQAGGSSSDPRIPKEILSAAADPRPLPTVIPPSDLGPVVSRLQQDPKILSAVIVYRGQLLWQHYQEPATENSLLLGWSMSKSLTAMLVGLQHCRGVIRDLDRPAEEYAPGLVGTAHGRATVRDLLKMRSAAPAPKEPQGNHTADSWRRMVLEQQISQRQYLLQHSQTKGNTGFSYNNIDTMALTMILEHQSPGGFLAAFDELIWRPAKTEGPGVWSLDRELMPLAYAGFHARARDWVRLALYLEDLRRSPNGCLRGFVESMTRDSSGYGYQTWTQPGSYQWRGYSGQRLAVDPDRGMILFVSSHSRPTADPVRDLWLSLMRISVDRP